MILIDRLGLGLATVGLIAVLASGCSIRRGNEEVSLSGYGSVTTYENNKSNKVKGKQTFSASTFPGNIQIELKRWGEDGKYLGMDKIKIYNSEKSDSEDNIITEIYDANGKLIETKKGFSIFNF